MKQFFIVLATIITLGSTAKASDAVSAEIVQSFISTFNKARDITWSQVNGYTVASFVEGTSRKSAYYDDEGNLVVVGRQVEISMLSAEQKEKLEKSFPGFSITYLFEMEDIFGKSFFATITDGKKDKVVKNTGKKWKCLSTRKK